MRQRYIDFPRIFIAGLRGGTGKTLLTIGIIAAWRRLGKSIAPYKKGPDYIDAGWLALSAGRPCYNLDTFLIHPSDVLRSFLSHTQPHDIAVIEGNRGLYDGIDTEGTTSSAEVAKLLKTPVLICLDCTKTTRTMAAVVKGCLEFDPDLGIKGVILNRIAGSRHEQNLRRNIEHYCGIPVVGAVPKLDGENFPERHMGLVPTPEHIWAVESVGAAAEIALRYLDMAMLERIALAAASDHVLVAPPFSGLDTVALAGNSKPVIGVIQDSAFQFYYPDNIDALRRAGAEVIFMSAFDAGAFPPVDGVYIGGGFPETHAERLASNVDFMTELKARAQKGMPIYAECGGLMYLGEALVVGGRRYPMSGILPIVFGLSERPQGLGYTLVRVESENPYFTVGTEIRGHEFRYSQVLEWRGDDRDLVFGMRRGKGFINGRDGILYKNVLATYTHIHALGMTAWAKSMAAVAAASKRQRALSDIR